MVVALVGLPLYLRTRQAAVTAVVAIALAGLALAVAPTTPVLLFDDGEVRTNALFGLLAAGAVLPGLRESLGEAEESAPGLRGLRMAHALLATIAVAACCLPFAGRGGGGVVAVTNAMFFLGLMLATAALRAPVPDWMAPTIVAGVTYLFGTLGSEGPLWWAFLLEDAADPRRLSITLSVWAVGAAVFWLHRRPVVAAD